MYRFLLTILLLGLAGTGTAGAEERYQSRDDFLATAFAGTPPPARVLWLTGKLREQVAAVLGHPPRMLRVRYWERGGRSAWVLDEIGKERPITAGFVVDHGRLTQARVLVFRESRGWEIHQAFFTRQFDGAGLDANSRLDRNIDGISGATLSVRAMKRMARLALLLAAAVEHSARDSSATKGATPRVTP